MTMDKYHCSPGDGHRSGNLPGLRGRRHLCAHGAGHVGAGEEMVNVWGLEFLQEIYGKSMVNLWLIYG